MDTTELELLPMPMRERWMAMRSASSSSSYGTPLLNPSSFSLTRPSQSMGSSRCRSHGRTWPWWRRQRDWERRWRGREGRGEGGARGMKGGGSGECGDGGGDWEDEEARQTPSLVSSIDGPTRDQRVMGQHVKRRKRPRLGTVITAMAQDILAGKQTIHCNRVFSSIRRLGAPEGSI